MEKLSFEDISIGYQLPPFKKEVSQEIINKNAVASLDYNPVHTNPEWCEKYHVFGTTSTVAHGMMTMSFMTSVVTNWATPYGWYISAVESKFTKPVPPGTVLTCTGFVKDKHYISDNKNFIIIELKAFGQNNEVYAVGQAKVNIC